jgi:hypothetical protein
MNIKLFFFIVPLLQLCISTVAQRVTLKEKNAPLLSVINKINLQTGYDFLFTSTAMQIAKPVTLNVVDADLNQVLQEIFDKQPLDYTLHERSVVIPAGRHNLLITYIGFAALRKAP